MTPAQVLARFAVLLLLFPFVGLAFAWVAWRVDRARGSAPLIGLWLFASLAATGLMAWRIHQQQSALGFTLEQQARVPVYEWFLPFWAAVFGAAAWRVHRRRHLSLAGFDRPLAYASLRALFAGAFAYFIAFVAYDIVAAQ